MGGGGTGLGTVFFWVNCYSTQYYAIYCCYVKSLSIFISLYICHMMYMLFTMSNQKINIQIQFITSLKTMCFHWTAELYFKCSYWANPQQTWTNTDPGKPLYSGLFMHHQPSSSILPVCKSYLLTVLSHTNGTVLTLISQRIQEQLLKHNLLLKSLNAVADALNAFQPFFTWAFWVSIWGQRQEYCLVVNTPLKVQ